MKTKLSFDTELGPLTVTAEGETVIRVDFKADGKATDETPVLRQARSELQAYAKGKRKDFTFSYRWTGTPFQDSVWRALEKIPYGKLQSYGELAKKIGNPKGSRAVGGAVGSNPLAIVVPCHRIITSQQTLGGFGGGLPWKKRLLALEGVLETVSD